MRAGKANARLLVASWHKDDAVDGGVQPRLVLRELHAGGEADPVLVLYCCLRMNGFRLIRLDDKADCCLDQEAWLTVDMLKSGTRTGGMAARVK